MQNQIQSVRYAHQEAERCNQVTETRRNNIKSQIAARHGDLENLANIGKQYDIHFSLDDSESKSRARSDDRSGFKTARIGSKTTIKKDKADGFKTQRPSISDQISKIQAKIHLLKRSEISKNRVHFNDMNVQRNFQLELTGLI